MAVKTDTLLMLGGLGLLGFGMFYMMNKSAPGGVDARAIAATDAAAAAANVQSQAQYNQMLGLMQQMMSKVSTGEKSKAQAQQELISGYVNLGIQGATQIVSAIGSFF